MMCEYVVTLYMLLYSRCFGTYLIQESNYKFNYTTFFSFGTICLLSKLFYTFYIFSSAALELTASMEVDLGRFAQTGVTLSSKFHTNTVVGGKLVAEAKHPIMSFDLDIDMPRDRVDIFDFQ